MPTWVQQNDQVTALLNGRSIESILNANSSQANELIPDSMRLDGVRPSSSKADSMARASESQNHSSSNPYAGSSDQRSADSNVKGINLGFNISDQQVTYPGQQKDVAPSSSRDSIGTRLRGDSNPMGAFNGSVNLTGAVGEAASKTSGPAMPKGTDMIASGVVVEVIKEVGMDKGLEYAADKVFGPGSSDSTLYQVIDNGLNVVEALKWESSVGIAYAIGKIMVTVVEKAAEVWPGAKPGPTSVAEQKAESEKRGKAEQQQAEKEKLDEDWWEAEQQADARANGETSQLDPDSTPDYLPGLGEYMRNASGYNRAQQAGQQGSQGGTADGTPVDGRGDVIVGRVTGVVPDQQQRMWDMVGQPGTEGWSERPSGDPTRGTNWGSSTGAGVVRPGDDAVYSGGAGPERDPLGGTPPPKGFEPANTDMAVGTSRNDIISGQSTNREDLEGKGGADRFRFGNHLAFGQASANRVIDFNRAEEDLVEISRQAFGLSASTALSFAQVANDLELRNASASSTLFIQDQRDGSLWFSQNGSSLGAGTGGVFAQFTNGVALQASDLSLIA